MEKDEGRFEQASVAYKLVVDGIWESCRLCFGIGDQPVLIKIVVKNLMEIIEVPGQGTGALVQTGCVMGGQEFFKGRFAVGD